jgi:hypothetical protein
MRLTDDELRDVLIRAEEIQQSSRTGRATDAEMRAVIHAAEEVGIERAAVERALRERFELPIEAPRVGQRVFARSADDKYYVAEVLSATPTEVRVRYLQGSEDTLAPDEVRPCTFRPGEKVMVYWPWWGPWSCTVISYYADAKRVEVTDGWGSEKTFDIAEVWLEPRKKPASASRSKTRIYITLMGVGSGIGAPLGSALTWLLVR